MIGVATARPTMHWDMSSWDYLRTGEYRPWNVDPYLGDKWGSGSHEMDMEIDYAFSRYDRPGLYDHEVGPDGNHWVQLGIQEESNLPNGHIVASSMFSTTIFDGDEGAFSVGMWIENIPGILVTIMGLDVESHENLVVPGTNTEKENPLRLELTGLEIYGQQDQSTFAGAHLWDNSAAQNVSYDKLPNSPYQYHTWTTMWNKDGWGWAQDGQEYHWSPRPANDVPKDIYFTISASQSDWMIGLDWQQRENPQLVAARVHEILTGQTKFAVSIDQMTHYDQWADMNGHHTADWNWNMI